LIDEAAVHAAGDERFGSYRRLYRRTQPGGSAAGARCNPRFAQSCFPHIGRRQKTEDVRKLVARKYPYLLYYTIDHAADEVVLLTIQHPARSREYRDE
jgi:hypothetical protein